MPQIIITLFFIIMKQETLTNYVESISCTQNRYFTWERAVSQNFSVYEKNSIEILHENQKLRNILYNKFFGKQTCIALNCSSMSSTSRKTC